MTCRKDNNDAVWKGKRVRICQSMAYICTRFSGFSTTRPRGDLTGVASLRRYARIPTRTHILTRICAMKRCRTKSFGTITNIGTIPKNMPTNFEPKQLKPKLDMTDCNGTSWEGTADNE